MTNIPQERKAMYYIGSGLMVLGFILFISVFFTVSSYSDDPFASMGGMSSGPSFGNALWGFLLIIIGAVVKNIGARGVAGSGVILDPEQAREDLKPYSEAAGGMINDVISNIDVVENMTKPQVENEVIKVRCKNCKSLNDEDAKYCKTCGTEL